MQWINQATELNRDRDNYYRSLAQVSLAEVQSIINTAGTRNDPNIQAEFTNAVRRTIRYAEQSTEANGGDSLNWAMLGFVYQSLVPLLSGSESLALQHYDKAIELDPVNPTYPFNKASVYVAMADRAQLQLSQGATSDALIKQRIEALGNAKIELDKSLSLKSDYPQANYLMSQVLIRQGNLTEAIKSVEKVKTLAAPTDIGIAFQLGVLYYQANDFAKAENEFTRAVAINDSYSNARYFLGLLYDRKGEKAKALEEFQKIQAFNPDNQEVKTIIANLQANKPALAGISPPAPAPEKRPEPPLKDEGH